jgi:hypothetical protein
MVGLQGKLLVEPLFSVLRDIMERFPDKLACAVARVFSRADPYTVVWD